MGRRSRKRSVADQTRTGGRSEGRADRRSDGRTDRLSEGYSRGREKDEQRRAQLQPLAKGERPGAVTLGAIVALALALANVGLYLAGVEVQDRQPGIGGVLVFAGLMAVTAWGMWRAKYWAVLGFQALLGITIVIAALSLAVASNLAAVALCLMIMGVGGWLFWKMIGAMARIQMPERPPARPR